MTSDKLWPSPDSQADGAGRHDVQAVYLLSPSTQKAVEPNTIQGADGGPDVQYTDGNAPPANPIGNALVFDESGTWKDVGLDKPFPVQAQAGKIVDLATLLTLAGASGDANTVASFMGRLTKIRDLLAGSLTETNSAAMKSDLDSIKTDLDEIATDTDNLAAIKTDLDSIKTDSDTLAGRENLDNITLIDASAVSDTQTSSDQTNKHGRGVLVFLKVGTLGTGSLVLTIQGKDPVSGVYTILQSAAVEDTNLHIYRVYPGLVAATNLVVNDILPRTWNVNVTGANGTTFKVSACVML